MNLERRRRRSDVMDERRLMDQDKITPQSVPHNLEEVGVHSIPIGLSFIPQKRSTDSFLWDYIVEKCLLLSSDIDTRIVSLFDEK